MIIIITIGYIIIIFPLILWILLYVVPFFFEIYQFFLGYSTILSVIECGSFSFMNPIILVTLTIIVVPAIFNSFYKRIKKENKKLPYKLDYKDYKKISKYFLLVGINNLLLFIGGQLSIFIINFECSEIPQIFFFYRTYYLIQFIIQIIIGGFSIYRYKST